MARKEDLFHHFRPEERMLVERVLDWADRAERDYRPVFTPFLNPREQKITEVLVRRAPELSVSFDGGFSGAERCRGRIEPPFFQPEGEGYGLAFLEVKAHTSLSHPDVLGSLLGLGVKREKIGDILSVKTGCQLVITEEMADFVRTQLVRVGKVSVRVEEISKNEILASNPPVKSVTVSVASLRVDAVASDVFRLSRTKATSLIRQGKCHINWKVTENPAEQVARGDVISLRGYGRARVGEMLGTSKKGRFLLNMMRYI
ncbi:RNA-binding protein [Paludifilum halophilum]|uniref:RNA-binding S4 domain-containing protein n=1 Tax=Paludifilum halophilum TaxID=1642702 RepID=A0A235B2V3_9BACL|nr:YlmH/Sll1252 family protein [Paludifilum halophilum]OYD06636.1 hypothetical protein CHM34_15100 [Paludifilum halophilum]